jgi:hypothetical protein
LKGEHFKRGCLPSVRFATAATLWRIVGCDEGGYNRDSVTINPEQAMPLQSGVLTSPADGMLSRAIAETLDAPLADRVQLFASLVSDIADFMAQHPEERPWTCTLYVGTDGSSIFRGGVGHSLVIDSAGHLWRARSYEDFETTYAFAGASCEIDTLTPIYAQMVEYQRR